MDLGRDDILKLLWGSLSKFLLVSIERNLRDSFEASGNELFKPRKPIIAIFLRKTVRGMELILYW